MMIAILIAAIVVALVVFSFLCYKKPRLPRPSW